MTYYDLTPKEIWSRWAMACVVKAKAAGVLPPLDGSIACVDCGAPAKHYDHRDYSRPLDVEPCCHSCNLRRGPAHVPSAADYSFKRIDELTPDAIRNTA